MTVRHRKKEFDTSKLRPYGATKRICQCYYGDECEIAIVSGMPEGIGKSGYVHHVLADTYGYISCRDKELIRVMWKPREEQIKAPKWPLDWETTKTFIRYLPEDVVELCKNMLLKGVREPVFHWDDAGSWLNAMDYHDPFVIAFMKYLSLARSNWGMVILSTPVEEWVLKKLRTAKGMLRVTINKPRGASSMRSIWRPRIAKAYRMTRYVGNPRAYWPRQWTDHFIAIVPDDFYKWYKPMRDKYALLMATEMEQALKKRKARGWPIERDIEALDNIKKHIDRSHDELKDFEEVIALATQRELSN